MFVNKLLSREDLTGELRKLHNEEIHRMHSSLTIVTMIKSECLIWRGHIAHKGKEMYAQISSGILTRGGHL